MVISIKGLELTLLPEKALFFAECKALFIADWHLGKAAHFRKSGISVPQPDLGREFDLVAAIFDRYPVSRVFFLGDLFHSLKNNDWNEFAAFVNRFQDREFVLIKGNHDLISDALFEEVGVGIFTNFVVGNRLYLSHEPLYGKTPDGMLNLAGHLHPGYHIRLKARQSITVPCYHYRENTMVLPAFGGLTGFYKMEKSNGDVVYCILGDEVVAI
jgi:DNA ligase-associated metallophosphoesterase